MHGTPFTRHTKAIGGLAASAIIAFGVGCGSDSGTDGDASASAAPSVKGAKVIDVASMENAKGTVTYCTGKDADGDRIQGIKDFNAKYGAQGLRVKILEFPETPEEQRGQFIQRSQARSSDCDIFEADAIWTAEFATQKWLYDVTPYIEQRRAEFLAPTLTTVEYGKRYWGVPRTTDAAFVYYRTDQVKTPPTTWQELYRQAADSKGFSYQGQAYEGLTCVFLELAFAAGGTVLNGAQTESAINSPANLKALQFMVDGIKSGASPRSVTTYNEEPARRAFEAGRVTFMRNWPYAYALNQKAPKIKGKFEVMPFPTFEGGGKAGILGGHNIVISAFSKNPGAALKVVDFFTSQETQTGHAVDFSKASVLDAVYDDPKVRKALPFAPELREAVKQAKSRPVSPVYTQISRAIYKNVNAALSGSISPQDALKAADDEIGKALATF